MARIRKEDHARILALVDVERRAVREIAAEYGCTPAAIYALLTKLRAVAAKPPVETGDAQPPLALEAIDPVAVPAPQLATLPLLPELSAPGDRRKVVTFERVATVAAPPAPPPGPQQTARIGARLAKPGMGLVMRTADGDETTTPFRSLDDLLSAIKPILRAGARSPDPVWFSLQPIDLSAIEVDAA